MASANKRKCKDCLGVFDLKNFASAGVIKGKQYYRYVCTTCYAQRISAHKHQVRCAYMSWKQTLSCECCGFNDYRALQFHHHMGDKEANVSDLMRNGCSLERIQAEASKCQVLCANCHSIRHANP